MSSLKVRFATKRRTMLTKVTGLPNHQLLHRAVVGIHVPGRPAQKLPRTLRWGEDLRVDVREVPAEVALRLDEFVRMHYVNGVQGFNCFSFMRFITAWDSDSADTDDRLYVGPAVTSLRTEPYRAYVMARGGASGTPLHGIVGLTSTVNLSVIGNNQPLTMAPTAGLMQAYTTDTLIEVQDVLYA